MGEELLKLRAGTKELALILSLLQQPRSIEATFRYRVFTIDYDWVRNLIAICEQRMSQHKYNMLHFLCKIYYINGRVDIIPTNEAFDAYINKQISISVGIDISLVYLVYFSDNQGPEKQEIRFQAFTEENYKYFITPKQTSYGSIIHYSISSTNHTWGEDMDGHIRRHIDTTMKTRLLSKMSTFIDENKMNFLNLSMIFVGIIFACIITLIIDQANNNAEALRFKFDTLKNDLTQYGLSERINLIMSSIQSQLIIPKFIKHVLWLLMIPLIIWMSALYSRFLVKQTCKSFIIFNSHTKALHEKHISNMEWATRFLIASLLGVPIAIFTAYVKGMFGF